MSTFAKVRRVLVFAVNTFAIATIAVPLLLSGCNPVSPDESKPQEPWMADADRAAKSPDFYYSAGPARLDDGDVPKGRIIYKGLDRLGRTGKVVADVTAQTSAEGRARSRDDMAAIHPSGWPSNNPIVTLPLQGRTYHGQLFNRSHLVAKSLGGENRVENMITGTRPQNVGVNDSYHFGGMQHTEMLVTRWLTMNPDGDVRYDATPLYVGDELIPRAVTVDMRSSDGALDEHVTVSNTAPGIPIDYSGHGDYSGYATGRRR